MADGTANSQRRKFTIAEGLAQLPTPEGKRFVTLFQHGSLLVEVYAPRGIDPQQPHTRDEIYVVAAGTGFYVIDGERLPIAAGDFLFAPAGVVHRFEEFTDDFVVWVMFYGAEGGEAPE